jgi:hypothetical protein
MIVSHGVRDGWISFTDSNGPGSLPVDVVPALAYTANELDEGYATFARRRFDRDVLVALAREVRGGSHLSVVKP